VGQISKIQGTGEAELALLIGDAFQGKGLGQMLTQTLLKIAALENVTCIVGDIHPANRRMLALCRKMGFQLNFQAEEETVRVNLPIASPA
jgi:acetyltransferase